MSVKYVTEQTESATRGSLNGVVKRLTAGQVAAIRWLKDAKMMGLPHTTNYPQCQAWDDHKPASVQSFYALQNKGLATKRYGWAWELTTEGKEVASYLAA